ncbi:hypothetical protein, partial [Burkholderia cepacia]|uniref:hypothetical protein n=1 Tax=Burkholderia cepacia TaxID=292 RepID=UPI001E41B0B8
LLQHPRSDMGWRRWHLGGILIGAIAATIREADRSPIDDDLGGDAGCLKVAVDSTGWRSVRLDRR